MSDIKTRLKEQYFQILSQTDPKLIFNEDRDTPDYQKLSDLFLPDAPSEWQPGKRVMILGRETRGWNLSPQPERNLETRIEALIKKQSSWYQKMTNPGQAQERGETFFNFVRNIAAVTGAGNIAWANLFCMDVGKTRPSPDNILHYQTIRDLSERLLKAQIEILAPNVLIIASGAGKATLVRREFFPTEGENAVCSNWEQFPGHAPNRLQSLKLNKTIHCFRINHPSSIRIKDRAARKHTLILLKDYLDTLSTP